jgi:hypothetical protein
MKPASVTIVKPTSTKFVKKNRLRDKDKCTAKVKSNRNSLTLRNELERNALKIGYQISCCGFDF